MIIPCYRIRSNFVNVADTIVLMPPDDRDLIYDEIQVVLPAGYEIHDTVYGVPCIYDEQGKPVELCVSSNHGSTILAVSLTRVVALKKAPEDRELVKLQEARLAAGLTARQLSDASGVNIRQIQRVENGESEAGNMTATNLLAIADALDVDPRSLI